MNAGESPIPGGIHHVTCVCHEWERTTAFYKALGFTLIKNTVNHDAPTTRHIYLADAVGTPGTVLTFFEWPSERRGRPGLDSAHHVAIEMPEGVGLGDAEAVLRDQGVPVGDARDQGDACLEAQDPDGLALRLFEGTREGPFFRHVGLYGAVEERTSFFRDTLVMDVKRAAAGAPPIVLGRGDQRALMLLDGQPGPGRIAPGAVHHVALAVDRDDQPALMDHFDAAGLGHSGLVDRIYFRSIYVRDPAGHILEFASRGPGFAEDEPADQLGRTLVLPAWLEGRREEIEAALAQRGGHRPA